MYAAFGSFEKRLANMARASKILLLLVISMACISVVPGKLEGVLFHRIPSAKIEVGYVCSFDIYFTALEELSLRS